MASWNHTRVDGKTEYWGASTQQGRKRQEQGYWVSRKEGRKVGRRKRDEHSENIHRIQTVTADKPPVKAKAQKWNPSYTRLWEPEGKGPTQEGLERYLVFPYPGTSLTKIKLIQTQVTKKVQGWLQSFVNVGIDISTRHACRSALWTVHPEWSKKGK